MIFTVFLLSIFVFIKTTGYAIYEYKKNSNKVAGVIIMILAVISLVAPCIVTLI